MITVSSKLNSTDPCAGKVLIMAIASIDPSLDICGDENNPTVYIYVDAATPTIAASYAAGNTLYSIDDCTQCSDISGMFYQDIGTFDPDTYYYFKGCELFIRNCNDRQAATVVTNVNRDFLCDEIGTTHTVYLDSNYTESLPFAGTGNTIYTTDGLYDAATGNVTANLPSGYYATYGEVIYTRFWTDAFGSEGGDFGTPQLCSEPEPATRYEQPVLAGTDLLRICARGLNQTVWADASNFNNATTMWTSETGTGRPADGYYTAALSGPFPNKIFEFSNTLLTDTGAECAGSEMPE
tara:strand:+ start:829 stop:1713 length:885 start_codon:yes stop_codon:yes gene_type:complete